MVNPKPWEEATAEQARDLLVGNPALRRWGLEVVSVKLDGEFPDTTMILAYRRNGVPGLAEARYHLWDDAYALDNGDRLPPDEVAFLVRMDVDGPGTPLGVVRSRTAQASSPDPAGALRALSRPRPSAREQNLFDR